MSLVAEAIVTSSRPRTLTWTAMTVSPPGTGTCSLNTRLTPATLIAVFGPGWMVTLSGIPPTVTELTTASPVQPEHVVFDVAWVTPTTIAGTPRTPIRVSFTDAVAVEVPG